VIGKLMQYVVCSGVATAYEPPFLLCLSVYCIIYVHVCNSTCIIAILITVRRAGKIRLIFVCVLNLLFAYPRCQ
jgi:hypothetical protein